MGSCELSKHRQATSDMVNQTEGNHHRAALARVPKCPGKAQTQFSSLWKHLLLMHLIVLKNSAVVVKGNQLTAGSIVSLVQNGVPGLLVGN